MSIPPPILPQGKIPQSAAEQSGMPTPETSGYCLSFEKYNDKLCKIENLESNRARKAIAHLKSIGTTISDCRNRAAMQRYGIQIDFIRCEGEYKKLYSGLSTEIELVELKLQGTGRIFYFAIDRLCYIVAITNSHFETNKNRR